MRKFPVHSAGFFLLWQTQFCSGIVYLFTHFYYSYDST